jgi:hypothetical protein
MNTSVKPLMSSSQFHFVRALFIDRTRPPQAIDLSTGELKAAQHSVAAGEPHPRRFDSVYRHNAGISWLDTIDRLKDEIAKVKARLATIRAQ